VTAIGPAAAGISGFPPEAWDELLALSQDDAADRTLLERLLEHWRVAQGAAYAALYLERDGRLELDLCAVPPLQPRQSLGSASASHHAAPATPAGLPEVLDAAARPSDAGLLHFPGGSLLFAPHPQPIAGDHGSPGSGLAAEQGSLSLHFASSLKILRLRQELKDQQFQVNYRVVELESLYDVGLAVAATLDLEKLSEEILLRAVSLLDARRGALYILEGNRYRLERTFGGDAAPAFDSGDAGLRGFLAEAGAPPDELLPGARYVMGVPIDIDGSPRGLLVAGDKESRRGVGPFPTSDRRTLGLFANQAAIALENARLHLQALEKERLEGEMNLAADIQRRILPRGAPDVAGFELIGWNRPARQIGGDYYDLFLRPDGKVGLVVGDVSGKGMPAALMVSTLHSALHLLLDQVGFGPPLLEMLNRHVLESSAANKFITLMMAELEPETGTVSFLNAGHNPALLLHTPPATGAATGPAVEELASSGLPIGLFGGSRYQTGTVVLAPGDLLCIYSDGITEAESPADEEFGKDRLLEVLSENRHLPLPELLSVVQDATGRFSVGLPQGDDQTVVLLRRNPVA
jgi:sigma-B regulation protein RsbU (phosphoserine phosphatase)